MEYSMAASLVALMVVMTEPEPVATMVEMMVYTRVKWTVALTDVMTARKLELKLETMWDVIETAWKAGLRVA